MGKQNKNNNTCSQTINKGCKSHPINCVANCFPYMLLLVFYGIGFEGKRRLLGELRNHFFPSLSLHLSAGFNNLWPTKPEMKHITCFVLPIRYIKKKAVAK